MEQFQQPNSPVQPGMPLDPMDLPEREEMPYTRLVLAFLSDDEKGGSKSVVVNARFTDVMNKIQPLLPPQNVLEHRANMTHTLVDGRKVAFGPGAVAYLEETDDPGDED